MSVSVTAYLGVGLMLDRADLQRDTGRPACGHDPKGNMGLLKVGLYCPECGKPLSNTLEEPIEGYDEDGETYREFGAVHVGSCDEPCIFVGETCGMSADPMHGDCVLLTGSDETGLDQRMADVRKALADAPFYDDAKFGLWLLTYCSY